MYTPGSSFAQDDDSLLPQVASEKPRTRPAAWRSGLRPLSPRRAASRCLDFMRPSFLRKTTPKPESGQGGPRKEKYSTEYLDGVRGVASFIVFILHWSHIPYPSVNSGWGYKGNTSVLLLPFVRVIYSGAAMVSVFFVVSGFVLSHRFVQRMHRREHSELFSGLTSLTFRRAIRLFLPAFASSTLAFACACVGVIMVPQKVDGKPFEHSFTAYLEYLDMESNPWEWTADFSGFYNPQLWSIAVEFRGSIVVFLMILGLAKTRTLVRLAVETMLMAHSFAHKRWDVALFIAGMLLPELEVLLQKPASGSRRRLVNMMLIMTLMLGLFLSGYPREPSDQNAGLHVVATHVAAVFITRPARYLGRISFALYLVHGLGNRTVGKVLLNGCWDYTISFVVSTTLYFSIVIWASDMFWRGVDVPATEFARWLERKCAAEEVAR
ncbi:Uu.00g079910.m01.CDS01 [Anthostomella pinea]|uniref:Uu.00g079910.m01.CDS01 n=1 Tax=Anthostomella pinea TaxID=933095 RepID=A0AAI8VM16_9PEZI|nr:Uu.00g079910.m01.CDS01 [Anthostomella pinea]